MTNFSTVLARSAEILTAAMVLLWLLSLRLRDASIVDPFWGTAFIIVAFTGFLSGDGDPTRRGLVLALTMLWGLRLSLHLLIRNAGHGEDPRYQSIRKRVGPRFPLLSLGLVFLFQGALVWIISLPLQVALTAAAPAGLTILDGIGAAIFAVGLAFEVIGDLQLTRFRADPAQKGRVLETGLWRYTRHPNYFGDALLWWGLSCFAFTTGAFWTVISPALMTLLLVRVSGVALLERTIVKRRPDYQAYIDRTSAFFPWFPKSR